MPKEKGLTPVLDTVLQEVEELRAARALLAQIWQEVGPYGGTVSQQSLHALQNYFDFDDSE